MSDEDHYYVAGYSAEDDPYSEANGVLKNKLGITNTRDLNELEADLAALAVRELLTRPIPKEFSVAVLQAIHKEIFGEVYPWAGQFRKVDIAKGDTFFETHKDIGKKLDLLFDQCKSKDFFVGHSQDQFAQELGDFLLELNRIHPFREGNGRTQRLLSSQMALNAGYSISWESVSNDAMKRVCIEGVEGDSLPMKKLIKLNLSVAPIVSLDQEKAQVMQRKAALREQYFVPSKKFKNEP
ncbi:Fic family protein [Janthinobacterium sp. PC23-8]|uniref:Fic/DOC family protein n=1 Tax=Janthinobacterium sp. PC23-8 TaxID=2012679 RepID=UPI000B975F1C|nr:Fic family protein [Janthinobacterium sp. PC23-8]OYO25895.1 hypothetical protein CD932_27860 [Janthinobacterium sp. PC23-8]